MIFITFAEAVNPRNGSPIGTVREQVEDAAHMALHEIQPCICGSLSFGVG
jgi:hypothetical protein